MLSRWFPLHRRPMVGTVLVAAGVVLAATILSVQVGQGDPALDRAIKRTQAEALLAKTSRLAQIGNHDRLCQSVAVIPSGTCRFLLTAARDAGWKPGPVAPDVVSVTRWPDALILHLRGTRLDGTRYTSDFEVMWTSLPDGRVELRSRTPIYWSGVEVGRSNTCESSAEKTECSGVLSPPHSE